MVQKKNYVTFKVSDLPTDWQAAVICAKQLSYIAIVNTPNGPAKISRIEAAAANECFDKLNIQFHLSHPIDYPAFERLVMTFYLKHMAVPCETFLPLIDLDKDQIIDIYLPYVRIRNNVYTYQKAFFDEMIDLFRNGIVKPDYINSQYDTLLSVVNEAVKQMPLCKEGQDLIDHIHSINDFISRVFDDMEAEALRIIQGSIEEAGNISDDHATLIIEKAKSNPELIIADEFESISKKLQDKIELNIGYGNMMYEVIRVEDDIEHTHISTKQLSYKHTLTLPVLSIPMSYYEALSCIK